MAGTYNINIIVEATHGCPGEMALREAAEITLRSEGVRGDVSLNILLTDDKRIKQLNRQFLGRDTATDVIAFGTKKAKSNKRKLKGFIGELAISVDTARQNAVRFGTTPKKEIFLYIVHGILHLLGYGDKTKSQIRLIEERQNKILDEIWRERQS